MATYRIWSRCQGANRLIETVHNLHRVEYVVHLMSCGRGCTHDHWAESSRTRVRESSGT